MNFEACASEFIEKKFTEKKRDVITTVNPSQES